MALLIALGLALLLLILALGGHSRDQQSAAAAYAPLGNYTERVPHVNSILAITGVQGVVSGASQTPLDALRPLPASRFRAPVAEYRTYAIHQLTVMEKQIGQLQDALRADDRAGAQGAWRSVYTSYLRLGAVYLAGEVATLNQQINGNPGGLVGGTASPDFNGLHRIEYGLWGTARPSSLLPWARKLDSDVGTLRVALPHVSITPLEYATRAHEILEDAVRDLLSGTDVPLSGEGVLGTDAGLGATEEVISTLRPLLAGRGNVTSIVTAQLAALQSTMRSLATEHGGQLPTNAQLTQHQSERLDSTIGGTLEALAQVPGALETEAPPQIPQIPKSQERIDP
jgi:iron uptake system EfeUOB component EfeO/EfeM